MVRLGAAALVVFAVGLRAGSPEGAPVDATAAAAATAAADAKLIDAVSRGDADAVRAALAAGADANGAKDATATPLTIAALKLSADDDRGIQILSLLLSNEADPNEAADVRPLYAAILRGSTRGAEMLVGAGADADVAGCLRPTIPGSVQGETSRTLATRKGDPFPAIVAKARPAAKLARIAKKNSTLERHTLCSH